MIDIQSIKLHPPSVISFVLLVPHFINDLSPHIFPSSSGYRFLVRFLGNTIFFSEKEQEIGSEIFAGEANLKWHLLTIGSHENTALPIKDALLINMKSRYFALFYLPFHHLVDQEYFSVLRNGSLLLETLYVKVRL